MGGHHVPDDVVRRRHDAGLRNFFQIYRPIATRWRFFDNSNPNRPRLLASGGVGLDNTVPEVEKWAAIERQWSRG